LRKGTNVFFSLFLYSFSSVVLLLFAFQFSIFSLFYLFHSPTSSSPTGRRTDWTYIHRKDKYTHQCSHFFSCSFGFFSLSLSLSIYSRRSMISSKVLSILFYERMFCSSNVALTVCFKRIFPLTVPTSSSPCRLRIIIDS
jgi:hypothetical protein